ncbi:tRNA (guanine(9)-N(1))-methyltransferase [Arachnomyces sp. PD_36]|nr:tRNA (guanine(9)-N(1))-methyltransferase [Arachnomyces sp. PD_36]
MEETERPRKLQKLDHPTESSEENGALPTGDGKSSNQTAEQATTVEPALNENGDSHDGNENEAIKAGAAAPTAENGDENSAAPTLSKNQLKKIRRQEKWDAGKEFRKAQKKQKLQERKARKRATAEENAQAGGGGDTNTSETREPERPRSRTLLPITFVIDCGYDGLMLDKERKSLGSQLTRSYSDNTKAPYGAHITISSFNGLLKERFDGVLSGHHENWKGVTFMQEDYMAAIEVAKSQMSGAKGGQMAGVFAGKEGKAEEEGEVVYLTSDSPDTLTELKPYSTYIIGGIVDKNRHKGICYKSAMDNGLKTAKLPIGEYMKMNSRFVLATNHVVEIMLKWLELGDWGEAFVRVMPKRKGGELKDRKDEETPEQEVEKEGSSVVEEVESKAPDTTET